MPMYKNKFNGRNNIAGINVARLRNEHEPQMKAAQARHGCPVTGGIHWSQRELSDQLQLIGHDIDKNAVQKMESGELFCSPAPLRRVLFYSLGYFAKLEGFSPFINDIELVALSRVFNVDVATLLAT